MSDENFSKTISKILSIFESLNLKSHKILLATRYLEKLNYDKKEELHLYFNKSYEKVFEDINEELSEAYIECERLTKKFAEDLSDFIMILNDRK